MVYRLITFLLFISLLSACKINSLYNQTSIKNSDFETKIKFTQLASGHIIIPVTIAGNEFSFLLDTGSPNIVSTEIAEELKLPHIHHQKYIDSQGNKLQLSISVIDEINIGGISFTNNATTIHNFDNSPPTIRCLDIGGVIGSNLMKKAIWKINFENNTITISDNPKYVQNPNAEIVKFVADHSGTPKIDVSINGVSDGKAVVDFGASGFYKSSRKTLKKLCKKDVRHKCKSTSGFGSQSSGAFGYEKPDSSYVAIVHEFNVGAQKQVGLSEQLLVLSNHSDKLLGLSFFENFNTTINWLDNEIAFEKRDEINAVRSYNSFGLTVIYENEKMHVGFVYNNSPASEADLQLGDQILQIDDFDFRKATESRFCEFLKSNILRESEAVDITILRKNKPLTLSLNKKDLFASK